MSNLINNILSKRSRPSRTNMFLFGKLPDFWKDKIKIQGTCWLWQGRMNRNGYGRIKVGARELMAHRVIWEFPKRKIREGMILDHCGVHCKHRNCVNPAHLSEVTSKQNTHRGKAKLFKKVIVDDRMKG